MDNASARNMWGDYLDNHLEDAFAEAPKTVHFCHNEKDANELAGLVKKGIKKATASLHCLYEIENETIPKVGDYIIITNWNGIAQCVIHITNINIIPFKNVTQAFAAKEGEGDKTLSFWRKVHRKFFTLELKEYSKKFSEDMLVICEEFEVVYQ